MRLAEITRRPPRPRSPCRSTWTAPELTTWPTGVGFFDHMLDQLARHSLIDMTIRAKGDLHIDDHHTVEDMRHRARVRRWRRRLGDKRGIRRYGACRSADGRRAGARARSTCRGGPIWSGTCRFPDRQDRHLRHRTGARILSGARHAWRHHAACRPDPRDQQPPHRRSRVQGRRPRAAQAVEPDPRAADAIPSTKGAL